MADTLPPCPLCHQSSVSCTCARDFGPFQLYCYGLPAGSFTYVHPAISCLRVLKLNCPGEDAKPRLFDHRGLPVEIPL